GTVQTEAYALAFAPDGKTLGTADRKGVVTLWEIATWKQQATLRPAPSITGGFVQDPCLSFSPDGTLLALGGMEALVLWDVAGRKELRRFPDPTGRWLAFAPDGKTLASAADFEVRLWDVATGARLHNRPGHDHDVWSVAVSPNGKVVASTCADEPVIRLWGATGKPLPAMPRHAHYVRNCVFSQDGRPSCPAAATTVCGCGARTPARNCGVLSSRI